MSRPWMPLNWGEFLRSVQHLPREAKWGYLCLICHYWDQGGLPTDEESLRRISQLSRSEWLRSGIALAQFFGPNWTHPRIDADIRRVEETRAKRQVAGMRGGLATRGKTNRERYVTEAIAKQTGEQSYSERNLSYFGESQQAEGKQEAGEKESKVSTELMEKVGQWKKK